MILSRVWYVLLGVAVAVALYVVYVAVGQYNRQTTLALKEGLASDSQTVEWALKIDARRRLDALLVGSVDPVLQQALALGNVAREGKLPEKPRADAKKALLAISDAIPPDLRSDAMFAVNRAGEVLAEIGFDAVASNDDFELGGYPAVNDALHGWLRDDVWVLGSKMYFVVARPVEYDVTQRPPGAIVGLKEVSPKLADDLAKRTRTSVAFYAEGKRVAAGAVAGFDAEKLNIVTSNLGSIDDKTYGEGGRSEARMLADDLGAVYARLPGDAWAVGGGFAVARGRAILTGPMGFLSGADDIDKANVPWPVLVGVVLLAALLGVGFTLLEHSAPLRELLSQAEALKRGSMDALEVARFRGSYRLAAQGINDGIERAIEKAGGVTRKPADLDSILGPTPAQPAMSAFSFPGEAGSAVATPAVGGPVAAPPAPSAPRASTPKPVVAPPAAAYPPVAAALPPLRAAPGPAARPVAFAVPAPAEDDDATMVGAVPADVMAEATGDARAALEEANEWALVYEEFLRTKKLCGEATDGLTYEKFSLKLAQNRDELTKRYACRRVRFSVYIKEGHASLKATPVRE
jgi:hypothetical protein